MGSFNRDGFVKTWYDQSVTNEAGDTATGNHATQATAAEQPLIVSAGSLVPDNGIDFDGTNNNRSLVAPSVSGLTGSLSMFCTSVRDSTGTPMSLSNSSSSGRYFLIQENASTSAVAPRNPSTGAGASPSVSGADRLTFALTTGATFTAGGAKGGAVVTSTADYGDDFSGSNLDQITIGIYRTVSPEGYFNGRIREILVYDSDQTANRGAIEANIGEAYSITGIPAYDNEVDGFVETWYDQSGNGRDATQATAGSQPKIVDEGSLVTSSGLASIEFDGTDDTLIADSVASVFSGTDKIWSHFSVTEFNNVDNSSIPVTLGNSSTTVPIIYSGIFDTRKYRLFIRDDVNNAAILESEALSSNTPYLNHGTTNGAAQAQFVNSNAAGTGSTNTGAMTFNRFTLGAFRRISTTDFMNGSISEFIVYNSDQSANRVALETNINSQYSIF